MNEELITKLNESIEGLEAAKRLIIREFALIAAADESAFYMRTFPIIMIFNRAINIVDAIEDAAIKRNILVQTALMRLLADLPMAAYRVKVLGAEAFIKRVIRGEQLNFGKAPNGESLMDAKVKKQVAKDFEGFEDYYDWACKGVHFSKFDQLATLSAGGEMQINARIEVGRNDDEAISAMIVNNNTTKRMVGKTLSAVKKYILSQDPGEPM